MEDIEIVSKIKEARAARNKFLQAALNSGIIVSKENKKREAAAREAFIMTRADVWNAVEFENGGDLASRLVDMLDAREWSEDAVFQASELLLMGANEAA